MSEPNQSAAVRAQNNESTEGTSQANADTEAEARSGLDIFTSTDQHRDAVQAGVRNNHLSIAGVNNLFVNDQAPIRLINTASTREKQPCVSVKGTTSLRSMAASGNNFAVVGEAGVGKAHAAATALLQAQERRLFELSLDAVQSSGDAMASQLRETDALIVHCPPSADVRDALALPVVLTAKHQGVQFVFVGEELQTEGTLRRVTLERPPSEKVLAAHALRHGVSDKVFRSYLDRALDALPQPVSCQTIALLVETATQDPDSAPEDWAAQLTPHSQERLLGQFTRTATSAYDRIEILDALLHAALAGQPLHQIQLVTAQLQERLEGERPAPRQPAWQKSDLFRAVRAPSRSMPATFRSVELMPGFASRDVIRTLWHQLDVTAQNVLLDFLSASRDGEEIPALAWLAGVLLAEEPERVYSAVIGPWSNCPSPRARAAAGMAVGSAATDDESLGVVLDILRGWQEPGKVWRPQAASAALGGVLGHSYPHLGALKLIVDLITQEPRVRPFALGWAGKLFIGSTESSTQVRRDCMHELSSLQTQRRIALASQIACAGVLTFANTPHEGPASLKKFSGEPSFSTFADVLARGLIHPTEHQSAHEALLELWRSVDAHSEATAAAEALAAHLAQASRNLDAHGRWQRHMRRWLRALEPQDHVSTILRSLQESADQKSAS